MKVNIGPYIYWWGPYQIMDLIFFWHVKYPEAGLENRWDYKLHDRLAKWLADTWFADLCQWIHNKRKRTEKIHIDHYDVWNMAETLASIALPMLKMLKEQKHGYPCSTPAYQYHADWQHGQTCFDFYRDSDNIVDEASARQWDEYMDKMIFAFECICDENDDDKFWTGEYDKTKEFLEDGWTGTREYDLKGAQEHSLKIQEGLDLFAKYYRNLWD